MHISIDRRWLLIDPLWYYVYLQHGNLQIQALLMMVKHQECSSGHDKVLIRSGGEKLEIAAYLLERIITNNDGAL
jgi:hypothetical protein